MKTRIYFLPCKGLTSVVAHYRNTKRLGALLVHRRLPPAFRQVSLTVCWYPFILLGGERHCESKVSCPRTQHNDRPRLEPRPSALTIRPPRLPSLVQALSLIPRGKGNYPPYFHTICHYDYNYNSSIKYRLDEVYTTT